jgi:hypothetical protein
LDTNSVLDDDSAQPIESENIFDSGFDLPEERQYLSASGLKKSKVTFASQATSPHASLSPTMTNATNALNRSGEKARAVQHVVQGGALAIGGGIGGGNSSRRGLNNIITDDAQFSFTPSSGSLTSNTSFLSAALPSANKGPLKGSGKVNGYQSIQTAAHSFNSVGPDMPHSERDSYS